ncbi:MAG TPA: hypothetical protein VFP54_11180 [Acidimicrobiales bacterium]|nr:hypothetical protein [Acidimicrobiales bacterium]
MGERMDNEDTVGKVGHDDKAEVGREAGKDEGYAGETGAEARAAAEN